VVPVTGIVEVQFRIIAKQAQHDSSTAVVTCGVEIKIYIDDVIGTIAIEFHGLVLANESALVPKNGPDIAQWIVYVKV
jgi:hypothetical protein